MNEYEKIQGTLMIKTVPMPKDINANGKIFGGWIMSQMDIGGALLAKELVKNKVVTVGVNDLSFLHPIEVGDVVYVFAHCSRVGRSSLDIKVSVYKKEMYAPNRPLTQAACGKFTFVAIDDEGRSREINRTNNSDLQQLLASLDIKEDQ